MDLLSANNKCGCVSERERGGGGNTYYGVSLDTVLSGPLQKEYHKRNSPDQDKLSLPSLLAR